MSTNKRGQANIIVLVGMIAAVIFVLYSGFTYINTIGLSSQIQITAQNSIYQTLAAKDYIIQQANYLFDEAQLFDAFSIAPNSYSIGGPQAQTGSSAIPLGGGGGVISPPGPGGAPINCGYINTSTRLPFIPISQLYYWHISSGDVTCLPDNQEILFGLKSLLNSSRFSIVNDSHSPIQSFLDINLTRLAQPGDVFAGSFSAPYLNYSYSIVYNRTDLQNVSVDIYETVCTASSPTCSLLEVFNGTVGDVANLQGYQFIINPEPDVLYGVLSQSTATSGFFSGASVNDQPLSPDSQFTLLTMPDGTQVVIYDTKVNNVPYYYLTPLLYTNSYTLTSAIKYDNALSPGINTQEQLVNGSAFVFDGVTYTFVVSGYPNGVFKIYSQNYAVLSLQPQFVYYKYLINEFQLSQPENLLFPNYAPLKVSFSLFPLYNPEVCISYPETQFTLQNCLSVAGYVTDTDYISRLVQIGAAFVNQSFPIGNQEITGFAQYELYNYLNNVIHGVNLKTVSVNGQPKYDWYTALLLAMGSVNGTGYLLSQLNPVRQDYFGTTIYNCSQSPSDLTLCRNLLSNTMMADIKNLFDTQIPIEVSFLSATPFDINVLNLSIRAREANSCPNSAQFSAHSSYNYTLAPTGIINATEETLGVPISVNFAYQNDLNATPTESCGLQNNPRANGYPGFTQTLATATQTYLNCAPIYARSFINTTCIATLETSDPTVASQIGGCTEMSNQNGNLYYCPNYKFDEFSASTPSPYQRWITEANTCPDYVIAGGQNFSYGAYTPAPGKKYFYAMVGDYGGGAITYPDTPLNWTYALINGTNLNIPQNFSVNFGVTISGPNPSFNLLLSTNQNLAGQFTAAQINSQGNQNGIVYYNNGLLPVSTSPDYAVPGIVNNVEVDKYGSASTGYFLNLSINSLPETSTTSVSKSPLQLLSGNPLGLLGFSTDNKPTFDSISYFFVHQYVNGYNPIAVYYSYEPVSALNNKLIDAFGLSTTNFTYYNQIVINSESFTDPYQLMIILNKSVDLKYMMDHFVKIFGVYSSGAVSQLAWWNQSDFGNGGIIWVNLGTDTPDSIYLVYGNGAFNMSNYTENGTAVFPVFFSNSSVPYKDVFNYVHSQKAAFVPNKLPIGNLDLQADGAMPPYIYDSTQNSYYEQFACITASPSLSITLLNATYSPYPPQFNGDSLYTTYNPLYPDMSIIGVSKTYNHWSTVGT